jgi:hypothetical protein
MAVKKNVLKFNRCEEITNGGGKFYRCTGKAGHLRGHKFGVHPLRGQQPLEVVKKFMPVKVAKKEKSVLAKNTAETFLKALTEYYANDRLAPGLVLAWLPDKNVWYGSVCRYEHGTKTIVTRIERTDSLANVLKNLVGAWRKSIARPDKSNLRYILTHEDTQDFSVEF